MIRVIVNGAKGAMGKIVIELIKKSEEFYLVCGVSSSVSESDDYIGFHTLDDVNLKADVLIDFSHFSKFDSLVDFINKTKMPSILATTGYSEDQEEVLESLSDIAPIFRTKNLSLGINLIANLLEKMRNSLEGFDIEIIEKTNQNKGK